jgi:hypothetical protein
MITRVPPPLLRDTSCWRPATSFFGTKPFYGGDETVLKQGAEYPFLIMQFIFDLIWTQSSNRYLAAMGQLQSEQESGPLAV